MTNRTEVTAPRRGTLAALASALTGPDRGTVALVGPDGTRLDLTPELREVLAVAVIELAAGRHVTVEPVDRTLTTQEAAAVLGVSRPTLVKLLEAGEIPFERPGRHRRVRHGDLLAYRQRIGRQRRAALDDLVAVAEQSGMYDEEPAPPRTR